MKVTCSRASLAEALGVVASAVPGQTTTPVALDVLMQATEGGLRLQSTDLTLFTEVEVLELQEVSPGDALVPVARLMGLIRELTTEQVVLERNPKEFSVTLVAGADEFRIMGHDPGDFPRPPPRPECPSATVENEKIAEAFRSVAFAASRDMARQQLQGVAVILEGKKNHFVASDGKRLAEYSTGSRDPMDRRREGIVPLRAAEVIDRFLALDSGDAVIALDTENQQILISHGRGHVLCRLLQGQMPDYVSMIPTEFAATVEGPAREILAAVRKAAVLTTRENAVVTLETAGGRFSIRVSSQDVGSGVIHVDNVETTGEEFSVSFSVAFLMDGLRVLGESTVRLGLQKGRGATVMHGGGRSFRYAFMPVIPHGAEG
jgi:DNA polymerase III subunit beta